MNKEVAILGIDPGIKGAVCLLIPETGQVAFKDTTYAPYLLGEWLREILNQYNVPICMIEDVHSIFGVSAKSNFNFGYNTGNITGIVQCQGISVDKVAPKVWQKYLGVKKKGKEIKKEVASICNKLYPHVNIYGARGGLLDGRSDSLAISHFARLRYHSEL